MGRGRKPNMGKHTQAIFYLPEELLTKLKLRRIQTGESASKFVARLLRAELIQETKQEDYHNFFKFGGLLKAKFYNQGMSMPMKEDYDWYSKMLLNAEVLTLDPEEWEDKEKLRIFDYNNEIDAYNASAKAYTDQLDFNDMMKQAQIFSHQETRTY